MGLLFNVVVAAAGLENSSSISIGNDDYDDDESCDRMFVETEAKSAIPERGKITRKSPTFFESPVTKLPILPDTTVRTWPHRRSRLIGGPRGTSQH
mmetsp:Transcript_10176/g.18580  ORF Transcript_10176/g.18580 Transcript_10176/m.18580 type:complete len:96 (-) Transcript_10176:3030-3317(-)